MARNEPATAIADQKSLIEDLAQSNQDYIKKFENLKLGIEEPPSISTTNVRTVTDTAKSSSPPVVNLFNISNHFEDVSGASGSIKNMPKAHVPSSNDDGPIALQHYFDMLTSMLKEVDEFRYKITNSSRSRVRHAIHDTFDQEMHILTPQFGFDPPQRLKERFACLVAASRDMWTSRLPVARTTRYSSKLC